MRRDLRAVGILLAGICFSSVAVPAVASDKAEARKHFEAGNALYVAEDFAGAAVEFEESVGLYPTKNGLFNLANCKKALHRYGEALAALDRMKKELGNKLDAQMREKVEQLDKDIRALVGTLEIRVSQAGAAVKVDGREVGSSPLAEPLIVGPGKHVIEVSSRGHKTEKRTVRLVSGGKEVEEFTLTATTPETQAPPVAIVEEPTEEQQQPEEEPFEPEEDEGGLSPLLWVGLAGTVALGATAGVFFGVSSSKFKDLEAVNSDLNDLNEPPVEADYGTQYNALYKDGEKAADKVDRFSKLAIGFGIGAGAFAVLTIVALGVDLSEDESEEPTVSAAPGGIIVSF